MCNTSPHAANNLVLAQSGTVVINHDSQVENPGFDNVISQFDMFRTDMNAGFDNVICQFDKLRTDMNAGFDKVYSRFEIVDSQFANLRTDMDAKFDKANDALNKTFFKFGSLFFTMMFAVLSVDRWWR